ncbi:MAG: L-2-amino-thiazoline-4-carboxylic acid hydrolase [Pseudomonadales bacterium]|nr:L-2-amino-thiazoline-4-carboxylic acid hydrolase [Pseudomonadales bacterium]
MTELTNFERVKIQMEYVVPLIKDLQALLGADEINNALKRRTRASEDSIASDKQPDFGRMAEGAKMFAEGGALDYDIIASGDEHFDMDVKRCQYAEMMDELGGREFGHLLVCNRDFAAAKRIGMTLTRTQTKMQGADYCDFRYRPARKR